MCVAVRTEHTPVALLSDRVNSASVIRTLVLSADAVQLLILHFE